MRRMLTVAALVTELEAALAAARLAGVVVVAPQYPLVALAKLVSGRTSPSGEIGARMYRFDAARVRFRVSSAVAFTKTSISVLCSPPIRSSGAEPTHPPRAATAAASSTGVMDLEMLMALLPSRKSPVHATSDRTSTRRSTPHSGTRPGVPLADPGP